MATERRWYDDAYTTTFDAEITGVGEWKGRPAVELDRTWFYPESGGQLFDTGTLGACAVSDVQIDDDARVWHVLDVAPGAGRVACAIDWRRRFDHMQQHTGQHVLSAAFLNVLDAPTLSSTLGAERCVIEVGLAEVTWRDIERVEAAANAVLWEDRELRLHWTDREGVARFALRKPPKVDGPIRVVEIPDWDLSACGGTHVRRTGEVGVVKVVRWERVRGNLRFEFGAGGRALADHTWRTEAMLEASKRRSLHDRDLLAHLERALEEREALARRLRDATSALLRHEARAKVGDPPRGVDDFADDRSREDVRTFAIQCLEAGAPWVVAGAAAPDPVIVAGRAKSRPGDLKALVPGLLEVARGKGGGSPDLVQVAAADADAARAAFAWSVPAVRDAVEGAGH